MYIIILCLTYDCGTSLMLANFINKPIGVATVYYKYVCRHASVPGEVI